MLYSDMFFKLNEYINNLEAPYKAIAYIVLYVVIPLLLAFLIGLSNKIDTK